MNRPEQDMQRDVFKHIRSRSMPGVFAFHCPNGGGRSKIEGAIFKGLGVVAGVPDIIAINRGAVYALELKADKKKKPTESQNNVHNALQLAGCRVSVAYSLDEALETLESWGLLKRNVNHRVSETHQEAREEQ